MPAARKAMRKSLRNAAARLKNIAKNNKKAEPWKLVQPFTLLYLFTKLPAILVFLLLFLLLQLP